MKRVVRGLRVAVLVCSALLFAADIVLAQAGSTAQISGTVRDESGGVLPGADVTATQTDTGVTRDAVSDANGAYVISNLPIGPYRLEVKLSGFRSYSRTGIVLQVNAQPVIDVQLALGDLNETVSVVGAAPLVETRSPTLGQVIENERILELPLNGRNSADLIQIAGPVVSTGVSSSRSMQGGVAYSVAGGQSFGVAYLLDGATHNNPYDNLNLPLPFPDALQEFRVETSALSPQAGMHSGASVNAVTKSGTNTFHGNVFEFLRDRRFNAKSPFAATGPDGKKLDDGLNRNQFGGTLGGPLRRDKIFFFGAYQGTRTRQIPVDNISFVPTAAMLAGDFTQLAAPACNGGRAVALNAPFVNNTIARSALSPAALAITGKLPQSTDPCGRVVYGVARDADELQAVGKVDVQLSNRQSVFGRYMATTYVSDPPYLKSENILTTRLGGRDNLAQSFTGGHTLILSGDTVNSIRFAFNRTSVHRTNADTFGAPDVGINVFSYTPKYSLITVNNAFSLGGGTESEARFDTNTLQFSDDLTLVRGAHQFGFGGNIAHWDSFSQANVRSPGAFTFDGSVTGIPLADFMTGNLAQFRQAAPNTLDMAQWYAGAYAADTWRVGPRVTLNAGVRWEPYLPQSIANGAVFTFDEQKFLSGERSPRFANAPAGLVYPGDPGFIGKSGINKTWTNFAPRVGAAWDVTGDGRTSVRGSYGRAFDFVNGQFLINATVAPPWGAEIIIPTPAGKFENPWLGVPSGNIFPVPENPAVNAPFPSAGSFLPVQPDLKTTQIHSWNTTVQRQIGENIAVSAGYIGSYTSHLWNVRAINYGVYMPQATCTLPDGRTYTPCSTNTNLNSRRLLSMQNWRDGQLIGPLDLYDDQGHQTYNGMLLTFQRRSVNGLSVNANYTLSKCMGHPSQGGGTANVSSGYVDPNNIDYDYGPCNADRRHIFNLTVVAATPEFSGAGWRVSGGFRATSGAPLQIVVTGDPARTGLTNQRPNLVAGVDPYLNQGNRYLNPAAFAIPGVGTLGNLPANSIIGPGNRVLDVSLVRAFRFGTTQTLEARVEAFNALNWFRPGTDKTPLQAPIVTVNSQTFGQILEAADPRIMQFAVKFGF
jgi:carboxypeptidase family protein